MKHTLLPLALCLMATTALAQSSNGSPPAPAASQSQTGATPPDQTTAVNAPPSDNGNATANAASGPNLCVELSAYVEKARGPGDVSTDGNSKPATSTAVQAPSKESQQAKVGGQDEPQKQSGLSAPVTHEAGAAAGPQGVKPEQPAQTTASNSAAKPAPKPAPAAGEVPKAPEPDQASLQQAQTAISAGDQLGCRESVQKMRRAGVALPPPLIALGALDPKFLQATASPQDGRGPAPQDGRGVAPQGGAGAPGAGPDQRQPAR